MYIGTLTYTTTASQRQQDSPNWFDGTREAGQVRRSTRLSYEANPKRLAEWRDMRNIEIVMTGSGHTFRYTADKYDTATQALSHAFQKLVTSKVSDMLVTKIVMKINRTK